MLINSKDLLKKAKKYRFAIPATNFIDLNSARVFVNVAEKRQLPLILSFAQSHKDLISIEEAALIGRYLSDIVSVPVVLHLDHGEDLDYIYKAIELGFTSVMFDGSRLSFDKNIEITKKVVNYAHKKGVSVEAELGHVGTNNDFEGIQLRNSEYTQVEEVEKFVKKTNVDSLAISIGTAHGNYKGEPKIKFKRLQEIDEVTKIPLVLHGGSSSGDDNLKRCALNGISKINIFTDFLNGAYNKITENNIKNYLDIKKYADEGMAEVLNHYYNIFQTKLV